MKGHIPGPPPKPNNWRLRLFLAGLLLVLMLAILFAALGAAIEVFQDVLRRWSDQ